MSAAVELLARCRAAAVELGVGSGGASLLWEAVGDPPADLLADLAANKAEVLALIRGPHGSCDSCGRALDGKRRCWRCCDRPCVDCGRPTGSAVHHALHPVRVSVQRQPGRAALTPCDIRRRPSLPPRRRHDRPDMRHPVASRKPRRFRRRSPRRRPGRGGLPCPGTAVRRLGVAQGQRRGRTLRRQPRRRPLHLPWLSLASPLQTRRRHPQVDGPDAAARLDAGRVRGVGGTGRHPAVPRRDAPPGSRGRGPGRGSPPRRPGGRPDDFGRREYREASNREGVKKCATCVSRGRPRRTGRRFAAARRGAAITTPSAGSARSTAETRWPVCSKRRGAIRPRDASPPGLSAGGEPQHDLPRRGGAAADGLAMSPLRGVQDAARGAGRGVSRTAAGRDGAKKGEGE